MVGILLPPVVVDFRDAKTRGMGRELIVSIGLRANKHVHFYGDPTFYTLIKRAIARFFTGFVVRFVVHFY